MARIKAGKVSRAYVQPKDPIFSYSFLTKRYIKSDSSAICPVPVISSAIYCGDHTTPTKGHFGKEGREC